MTRIFIAKTKQEEDLVAIITSCPGKTTRVRALRALRNILNDTAGIPGIQSKEVYESIPGKPSYFRRFKRATITYEDTIITR